MVKGTIVLAPFPFTDLSSSKVRPALCLSESVGSHNQIVLAFISSKVGKDPVETDIILDSESGWFPTSGLKVKSVLKLHKLVTTEQDYIRLKLGRLPESVMEEVDEKLMMLFSLNHSGSGDFAMDREELLKTVTMEEALTLMKKWQGES